MGDHGNAAVRKRKSRIILEGSRGFGMRDDARAFDDQVI